MLQMVTESLLCVWNSQGIRESVAKKTNPAPMSLQSWEWGGETNNKQIYVNKY